MSADAAAKLSGIDFESSYLLNVIYDDESLTLEMDWRLEPGHPRYEESGEEGCYRQGFIRFADIADLRLAKARGGDGGEATDYSVIDSVSFQGDQVSIACGWGKIDVSASSVRVAVD